MTAMLGADNTPTSIAAGDWRWRNELAAREPRHAAAVAARRYRFVLRRRF